MKRYAFTLLILAIVASILPGSAVPARAASDGVRPGHPERSRPTGPRVVPDQIIIKFKATASPTARADVLRQEGLQHLRDLGLIRAQVVKVNGRTPEAAMHALSRRPEIEYAEPDYILRAAGYKDEPQFGQLWGHHNSGQSINGGPAGTADVDINALESSARTLGNPNLTVAVIDDGVDFSHPDLKGRQWVNPGESGTKANNGVDDDGNGYVDDVNGWDFYHGDKTVHDAGEDQHGTHVAGTIAANLNGTGMVGIAPNIKVMALKFLGPMGGHTSDAILAIQYAKRKGVRISNNSWGGGGYSQALKDAIDASGMLFVAAAGNGGSDGLGDDNDTSTERDYPASYTSPNILSVAAVDNTGRLASFSNYGATSVDISAPGVDVLSSVPAIPARSGLALSSVGTMGGKALTAGFGAEEIYSASAQASFMSKALQAVGRGAEAVVLVDDDLSWIGHPSFPDVSTYLASAIQTATGAAPTVISVNDLNGPSLSQLQGKVVVWSSGWAYLSLSADQTVQDTALTLTDQSTLTDFLNTGGKLVLTGQDLLYGSESSSLVTDVLLLHVTGDAGPRGASDLTGAANTVFAGESYDLKSNYFAYPYYHDVVTPAASSNILGSYTAAAAGWEYWPGTSMATPHVTGVAALVASLAPGLAPAKIKQVVMEKGKPLSLTAGKTVTGKIVNARAAVDAVKLVAKAPIQTVMQESQINLGTTPPTVSVRLTWAAATYGKYGTASGVRYQLQRSVNGGAYTTVSLPSSTARTITQSLSVGSTYRYRVMASNTTGNASTWAVGSSFKVEAYQEAPRTTAPTLAYKGSWTTVSKSGAYGGKVRYANYKSGVVTNATFAFTGRNVAVVMPKSSTLGAVKICIDGTTNCNAVDLSPSSGVGARKVVFTRGNLNLSTTHKITVTVTAGRAEIDAFVVLR